MEINNYQFTKEETNAYLLLRNGHGILVDPCSPLLTDIISELGVELDYVCITHEHCDHLWGLNAVREAFGCPLIASSAASAAIQSPKTNRASAHHIYMTLRFGAESAHESGTADYYCRRAEIEFDKEYTINWEGVSIRLYSSPGHSKGSIIIVPDEKKLIVGDTMLRDEKTFTGFEGGDREALEKVTLPFIYSFPEDTLILPGHGESFLLKDHCITEDREDRKNERR